MSSVSPGQCMCFAPSSCVCQLNFTSHVDMFQTRGSMILGSICTSNSQQQACILRCQGTAPWLLSHTREALHDEESFSLDEHYAAQCAGPPRKYFEASLGWIRALTLHQCLQHHLPVCVPCCVVRNGAFWPVTQLLMSWLTYRLGNFCQIQLSILLLHCVHGAGVMPHWAGCQAATRGRCSRPASAMN